MMPYSVVPDVSEPRQSTHSITSLLYSPHSTPSNNSWAPFPTDLADSPPHIPSALSHPTIRPPYGRIAQYPPPSLTSPLHTFPGTTPIHTHAPPPGHTHTSSSPHHNLPGNLRSPEIAFINALASASSLLYATRPTPRRVSTPSSMAQTMHQCTKAQKRAPTPRRLCGKPFSPGCHTYSTSPIHPHS